jgi:hypothetical protein
VKPPSSRPQRVWNTLYPGQTIVDRRGFTQKDDPATAEEYQFMYGVLTVYSQATSTSSFRASPLHRPRGHPASTSDPLVCDQVQPANAVVPVFQIHQDKHV